MRSDTPIGNTPRSSKLSYVGLVHSCLETRSPGKRKLNQHRLVGSIECDFTRSSAIPSAWLLTGTSSTSIFSKTLRSRPE
jgi:hypothetical protein